VVQWFYLIVKTLTRFFPEIGRLLLYWTAVLLWGAISAGGQQ